MIKPYKLNQYIDIEIDDIELEDIHPDMPLYEFTGKSIEKILVKGPLVDIKFTDGTYGHIFAEFPFHEISRDKYREYVEEGRFGILGFTYYKNPDGSTTMIGFDED